MFNAVYTACWIVLLEQAVELDVYSALDRKAQSVNADDQPEGVYTAIILRNQTNDNDYANAETN